MKLYFKLSQLDAVVLANRSIFGPWVVCIREDKNFGSLSASSVSNECNSYKFYKLIKL